MIRNVLLACLMGLLLLACGEDKAASGNDPLDTNSMQCNLSTLTLCSAGCTDTRVDSQNCGTCGNICNAGLGESCSYGVCTACAAGVIDCGGGCNVEFQTDRLNCGGCGIMCGPGQSCQAGACVCDGNTQLCDTEAGLACAIVQSDPTNCGGCGNVCPASAPLCSNGTCVAGCDAGQEACGGGCVDTNTDQNNCGGCGNACPGGQACNGGVCGCPQGQLLCGAPAACTNILTSPLHCGICDNACEGGQACNGGACACAAGRKSCDGTCIPESEACTSEPMTPSPMPTNMTPMEPGPADPQTPGEPQTPAEVIDAPEGRTCPVVSGLIADFEEGSAATLEIEGRVGLWDGYGDDAGTQTVVVETEGTDECNQGVFHASGSGFSSYAGIATVLKGVWSDADEEYQPDTTPYDASEWNAISFRAKAGPGQTNAVRFSVATPWTDGTYGDGSCQDEAGLPNACWNHLGHFLADDEALTQQWQTYTFCFDRDFYPMFMQSHVTAAQRKTVAQNLLAINFQFNQGFDAEGEQDDLAAGFDFFLDDVRFVTADCAADDNLFESTDGAAHPFPQNQPIGSCSLPENAAAFNQAISEAYARWKQLHVRDQGNGLAVWSNEDNRAISESIGYGLLIAAAMGDKPLFDGLMQYWNSNSDGGTALMTWTAGGSGSATDADTDAAYALLMADAQWGGYAGQAQAVISAAMANDVNGTHLMPGSNYDSINPDAFNASYFSPSFYRAFGGWDGVISSGYGTLNTCTQSFGGNPLPSDWCDGGNAVQASAIPADVQSLNGDLAYGFDAARTPFRIGLDACVSGASEATSYINALVGYFANMYGNGEEINLMVSGFDSSGNEHSAAEPNQMSFIGPVGVGAMAAGDNVTMESAFRATLDLMERPEFYHTYYPTTVGLMSLLVLTGNFPQLGN